jgi:transposase
MIVTEKELCDLFRLKSKRQLKANGENRLIFLENGVEVKDEKLQELVLRFKTDKTLDANEVCERYNVKYATVVNMIKSRTLAYFKLTNTQGSKYLFFESDLQQMNTITLNYHPSAKKNKIAAVIDRLAKPLIENNILREHGYDVFSMYYFKGMTYEDIAKELNIPVKQARQMSGFFQHKCLGALRFLISEHRRNGFLELQYSNMRYKYDALKEKHFSQMEEDRISSIVPDVLSIKIRDVFGQRVFNCLHYGVPQINTLGDLIRLGRYDLVKRRNFGKKCMDEVDAVILKHGLTLRK